MIKLEKFCFTSLSNGTIVFGWFTIFYSLLNVIYSIFELNLFSIIWFAVLGVGPGVLLLIAVKRSQHTLMLPWLGCIAFQIVILAPITLIYLTWQHLDQFGFLIGCIIYLALVTLVYVYGWIGVFSYYNVLKSEKQYGASASSGGVV